MAVQKAEPGRLAEGREVEVDHVVEVTGLSRKRARELLTKYGNDWERIKREAEAFKAES